MTDPRGREDPAIRIMKNGPYVVSGGNPLSVQVIVCDTNGEAVGWRKGKQYPVEDTHALCLYMAPAARGNPVKRFPVT